jgi:nucleoside-diphosphate-sugar epimerase
MEAYTHHVYGFTKRLGEEVCRNAGGAWGMSVNVLRLCLPVADEQWYETVQPDKPTCMTAASDLAQALLAALEYRNGFQAFLITGDYEQKTVNMSKAKQVLGWEPLARPRPLDSQAGV